MKNIQNERKVMKKKDEYVMTIRLTKKEEEIMRRLKSKYAINISQYLRNQLVELDDKLSKLGNL